MDEVGIQKVSKRHIISLNNRLFTYLKYIVVLPGKYNNNKKLVLISTIVLFYLVKSKGVK